MRNKAYALALALALVFGFVLVRKAGEAFSDFQKTQTAQFEEAMGQ